MGDDNTPRLLELAEERIAALEATLAGLAPQRQEKEDRAEEREGYRRLIELRDERVAALEAALVEPEDHKLADLGVEVVKLGAVDEARREGARDALKDAESVVASETEEFGSVVQRAAVHAVKTLRRALGEVDGGK